MVGATRSLVFYGASLLSRCPAMRCRSVCLSSSTPAHQHIPAAKPAPAPEEPAVYRPASAEAEVADELAAVRPDLAPRYAAELPGARAAVLTRLWRALAHEPLPWITGRDRDREGLTLHLRDGRRLHGPAADPYATGAYV